MRHRDPHDDPPAKRRPQPYRGPPVTLGHIRSHGVRQLADLLHDRPLPSQRGHQRRSLAGRHRAPGPGPEGGLHQVRNDRRGRAAELERAAAAGEPDRHARLSRSFSKVERAFQGDDERGSVVNNIIFSIRYGGEGGIRTPDTVARMPHFECGAIDHSATSPVAAPAGVSRAYSTKWNPIRRKNRAGSKVAGRQHGCLGVARGLTATPSGPPLRDFLTFPAARAPEG